MKKKKKDEKKEEGEMIAILGTHEKGEINDRPPDTPGTEHNKCKTIHNLYIFSVTHTSNFVFFITYLGAI